MARRRRSTDDIDGVRTESILDDVKYEGDAAKEDYAVNLEAQIVVHLQTDRKEVFDTGEPVEQPGLVSKMSAFPSKKKGLSAEIRALIVNAIRENVVLNDDLSEEQMNFLADSMRKKEYEAGAEIYKIGESSSYFFVIESGRIEYKERGQYCGEGKRGHSFGELGIVYNANRDINVYTTEPTVVWILDATIYKQSLGGRNVRTRIRSGLAEAELFAGLLDRKSIDELAEKCSLCKFNTKDIIFVKGDTGSVAYFLLAGQVNCTRLGEKNKLIDVPVSPGQAFGVSSLIQDDEIRRANVIVVKPSEAIAMEKEAFLRIVEKDPRIKERLDYQMRLRQLQAVPILSQLTAEERSILLQEGVSHYLDIGKGTRVVSEGKQVKFFFVILEGTAKVSKRLPRKKGEKGKSRKLKVLLNGDYFGSECFAMEENRKAQNDVITTGQTRLLAIDNKNKKAAQAIQKSLRRGEAVNEKAINSKTIGLNDITQLQTLGSGSYGRVKLVEHKRTKQTYALKIIQKARVMQSGQLAHIISEKTVMYEAKHPFILKLVSTFQSSNAIYMLTELLLGGDLWTFLKNQKQGKVGNAEARFYSACIVEAFSYLHDIGYVYRDLKPENVMIDGQGYLRLIDFGMAKKMKSSAAKTYTHCGTNEYMAPEIIRALGHNRSVDYWAIGIITYELMAGRTPFRPRGKRQKEDVTFKKILSLQYSFPKDFPHWAMQFVKGLLVSDTSKRMGMLQGGSNDLKKHKWFMGLDWRALYNKSIEPPWIPKIKNTKDTTNFVDEDDSDDEINYLGGGFQNW